MLEKYSKFCYDQIGTYILEYMEYFEDVRPKLSKANIEVSLPEYASMTVFSALLAFLISFALLGTVFVLSTGIAGIILGLTAALLASAGTLVGFFIYPSIMIQNRAAKIRDTLPFATLYLSTLAGTGTELPELFKALAQEEEYEEVSKEAERITRDIENFGMDVSEALRRAADRTPSKDFKELIWGINHVVTTGGSLRSFLQERAQKLMNDYQRRVDEFADQLSLLVEMYITLVIVGSIIFTSMSAVMSSFSQMSPDLIVTIQLVAIVFVLPFISVMFIVFVKGIAPGGIR